jgi:hypothetical protein
MLECPDSITRLNVTNLVKFIILKLKVKEKDILYDTTKEEVEYRSQDGQLSYKRIEETPVAITTKFINKCLDNLNTLIAKNWARFDYFLEVLASFATGDQESG